MSTHHQDRGRSLAKGPAAIVGLALLAYGVTGLIFGDNGFSEQAFDGTVDGEQWLGVEANGWTNLLFAAGGALLLFGALFALDGEDDGPHRRPGAGRGLADRAGRR